jgi:hypothetical protein
MIVRLSLRECSIDLLTLEAKTRKVSTLKGAAKYLKNPGKGLLHFGELCIDN